MSVINTNVKSLVAQNAATVNNRSLSKAMEQLSTGKRINGAADDAAGLAISNKMTSQIRGLNQAVRNANDGISMLQTVEGATKEITNMLQRMRELAVQSANDTNTSSDRTALDSEFKELTLEIDRIAKATEWNGKPVMSGRLEGVASTAGPSTPNVSVSFQVGANANQTISVDLRNLTTETAGTPANAVDGGLKSIAWVTGTGGTAFNIQDATRANTAITTLSTALGTVDSYRADLGAKINRLTYAADNLTNVSQNTSESRSRILDTDYASTTTELARTQIISQAATAMLAQANQAPQSVLSLLR
jgi:flagellin